MLKALSRLLAACLVLCSFVLFPVAAHAVNVVDPSLCNKTSNPDFVCNDAVQNGGTDNPIVGPNGILTKVLNILSLVLAVIAVIVIVIAGIRYTLSQGDPGKLNNARNTIIYALVAIVIAAAARAIVALVLKKV